MGQNKSRELEYRTFVRESNREAPVDYEYGALAACDAALCTYDLDCYTASHHHKGCTKAASLSEAAYRSLSLLLLSPTNLHF